MNRGLESRHARLQTQESWSLLPLRFFIRKMWVFIYGKRIPCSSVCVVRQAASSLKTVGKRSRLLVNSAERSVRLQKDLPGGTIAGILAIGEGRVDDCAVATCDLPSLGAGGGGVWESRD
jgi:hypothetical protein